MKIIESEAAQQNISSFFAAHCMIAAMLFRTLFTLTLFSISVPAYAKDPFLNVASDCTSFRRLDQPYQISNGEFAYGSMQFVPPVNEDIGICFAVTASYLLDAWLHTYSAHAVKTNYRTSPLDLALLYDQENVYDLKRDQAVNGGGYSAGFSFLGGFHSDAMNSAIRNGVCNRNFVVTESKGFDPALQHWVIRSTGAIFETADTNKSTDVLAFLRSNSKINSSFLPNEALLKYAIKLSNPTSFYRLALSSQCLVTKNRVQIPFAKSVQTMESFAGANPVSSKIYELLSRDSKEVQPIALSFCAAILISNDKYDIAKDPELKACRNHSSVVMGYCNKPNGKRSYLIREIAGATYPVSYRNERKNEKYPAGYYDDGRKPTGNYWVDEEALNRTAKSISWIE